MQPFGLTKLQQDIVLQTLGMNVRKRLVNCQKLYNSLYSELIKINNTNPKEYLRPNSIVVPEIIDLEAKCENFLYETKSALRDLLGIFQPFFNMSFSGARYDEATKWAGKRFGKEDEIFILLNENHQQWIKKVITLRDVVEHPGSKAGPLIIKNVKLINSERPPFYKAPTWKLKDEQESAITKDMEVIIHNILILSEDLLMATLKKIPTTVKLAFYEIPEEKRDPQCPKRVMVNLHPDEMEKLDAAIEESTTEQ